MDLLKSKKKKTLIQAQHRKEKNCKYCYKKEIEKENLQGSIEGESGMVVLKLNNEFYQCLIVAAVLS